MIRRRLTTLLSVLVFAGACDTPAARREAQLELASAIRASEQLTSEFADSAVKAIRKRHYEAYRQQESERNRIYKSINRAKIAATDRKWRSANPEKRHVYACNRRARFRLAEGRHTAEDIVRIYQAQAGKCAYCKIRLGRKYHVDHIVALTKGGSNWPRNIQLLCGPCNIRKRDHDPLDYARSRGLLL